MIITSYKIIIVFVWLIFLPFWVFTLAAFSADTTPSMDTADIGIVFGASVRGNEKPSLVLQYRLDQAKEMYDKGYISKILVTGDNRRADYNEPLVMKQYLIQQGVPKDIIIEDFAGRRTIDSCWRAKNVFQIEKAYLITQTFHLPRATFLCTQAGILSIPVAAKDSSTQVKYFGIIREVPASWLGLTEYIGYEAPVKADGKETTI